MSQIIPYGPSLTLADAKHVMAAAEREAVAQGLAVIIAIVDSAAQLVLLHRLDQAQFGSIGVAVSKAEATVKFKRPTKAVEDALAHGGVAFRLLAIPGIVPIDGGLPLIRDGRIVGGIGVAGMQAHQDGQVAAAGAAALPAKPSA